MRRVELKNNQGGNTCQCCGKIMNSKEMKNSNAVYVKEDGKRGNYYPACSPECTAELLKKFQ